MKNYTFFKVMLILLIFFPKTTNASNDFSVVAKKNFVSKKILLANIAPIITATGNQNYCPGTSQKIVETITITNDPAEPDTDAIYIQISSGYVSGQDLLALTNPLLHPTITTFWSSSEGKLKLYSPTGIPVSYSDFEAAIKDVTFTNSSISPSGTRDFSINLGFGSANYLPSNGHFYEYVPSLGINWTKARDEAAAKTYYGLQGYLATLTAADETQLAGAQAPGTGWIGGSDAATEGTWKWVTGPEAGTTFWIGKGNGATTPPFNYANWNTSGNEPNDSNNEDYAHITSPALNRIGTWNDLRETGDPITNPNYYPQGYIVEYGGMSGEPTLQISASTSMTMAQLTVTAPSPICASQSTTLQASSSTSLINWYDAASTGNLLQTGNSFTTPPLITNTTYYIDYGCPIRIPIIATVNPIPSITGTSPDSVCDTGTVTLGATASAGIINWYNAPMGGTLLGTGTSFTTPSIATTTTFYIDAAALGCTTATRTAIIATVNISPTITSTSPASRCDIGSVILGASASAGIINWYDDTTGGTSLGTGISFTTPNITSTTTYYVDATASGCTSPRTPVVATIYPIIKIDEEVILCQNETATLDATIPGMIYLWSPGGETTETIIVSTIGDYSVSISSPTIVSCDLKKNISVIEHPAPIIKAIIVNENSITIELEHSEDYYEFSIDGELFKASNQFSYIPSGQHTVYVREKNLCNLVQQDFTIFTIAKYFTPNNDGFNDTWEIKEMENAPNSSASIFNRYGKLITTLSALKYSWNGNYNNNILPADDYWYVLKMEDSKPEIRGHFSLKR
jgi:gliding motility-associated-like protein